MKVSATVFKNKMGKYMKAVREGKTVVITDRDQPVAKLIPLVFQSQPQDNQIIHKCDPKAPPLGELHVRRISYDGPNTTELLMEDRSRR